MISHSGMTYLVHDGGLFVLWVWEIKMRLRRCLAQGTVAFDQWYVDFVATSEEAKDAKVVL